MFVNDAIELVDDDEALLEVTLIRDEVVANDVQVDILGTAKHDDEVEQGLADVKVVTTYDELEAMVNVAV